MQDQVAHVIVAQVGQALVPEQAGRLALTRGHGLDQRHLQAGGVMEREAGRFLGAQHLPGFILVLDDVEDDEAAGEQKLDQAREFTALGLEFIEHLAKADTILNDVSLDLGGGHVIRARGERVLGLDRVGEKGGDGGLRREAIGAEGVVIPGHGNQTPDAPGERGIGRTRAEQREQDRQCEAALLAVDDGLAPLPFGLSQDYVAQDVTGTAVQVGARDIRQEPMRMFLAPRIGALEPGQMERIVGPEQFLHGLVGDPEAGRRGLASAPTCIFRHGTSSWLVGFRGLPTGLGPSRCATGAGQSGSGFVQWG